MPNIEEAQIRKEAEKHLTRCRPGDWQHALRVVYWAKELGKGRNDLLVIITAAYIHDIGWEGILPKKKITFDELLQFEPQANKNSAPYATKFLKNFNFSQETIETIKRLIRAADLHDSIKDDEAIIVDADSLSKLTIDHLKEKYEKSEWMNMHDLWFREYPKRIKTQEAKERYPTLLSNLKNAIQEEKSEPNAIPVRT